VLGGEFDPEFVEAAARRLQQFGLAWDGSRLLGQAAAHSSDRHTIAGLLQAARSMQQTDEPASAESSPTRGPVERAGHPAPERLSPRELDIALLLLQQRTYREIGHQLFISPKTVEHHVARMKQRLGVSGRADLLARLRALSASR
jgi:DNA-binding CsgD family transcriptional regulator